MLFSFEELIASLSRSETIHAGEFIGSGTVENGCGLELNRFPKAGWTIELSISRIGTLRNYIAERTCGTRVGLAKMRDRAVHGPARW